jgi:NADP-dependent 3-hydroxy acid dehydrogenase YdfG
LDKKRVVLITGASSGMGRKTALFLSNNNFIVYARTRNIDKLDDIKNKNLIPIYLDITNYKDVQNAINTIYKKQKHIDILIKIQYIVILYQLYLLKY